jgi:hypothetical protein
VARVTILLSRCLHRLGPVEPVDAGLVRSLSVGDREALLLHLRRLMLGDRITCLLSCPACAEKMDLDLETGELLLPAYSDARPTHAIDLVDAGMSYRVTFRLPTGADQEAVAAMARNSVDEAANALVRACVQDIEPKTMPDIPPVVLRELPVRMAAADPQAELLFDLTCPACAAAFIVPFDAADYLFRELATDERDFYRQVHALCWHYRWSEDSVLGLTRRKRRLYLEFLADDVAMGGRA